MSEKRYLITAKTKGKDVKVLFLSKDFNWAYGASFARICSKQSAKEAAKDEPTHCLIVEAKEELLNGLSDIHRTPYNEFRELVDKFNCKTISTRKEKKPKTQAAPEVQEVPRSFVVSELTVKGVGEKKIEIWDEQSDEVKPEPTPENNKVSGYVIQTDADRINVKHKTYLEKVVGMTNAINTYDVRDAMLFATELAAKEQIEKIISISYPKKSESYFAVHDIQTLIAPEPTPEEKREYVLYRNPAYKSGFEYHSQDGSETFDKSFAQLMTFAEANEKKKELSVKGQYQWIPKKVKIEQETPTPEASPATKKRVGYVLFGELTNSTKIYRHETKIVALLSAALDDAEPADVYMTKEQAEFIAYTVNKCAPEFVTWQVEEIEF
jgi:hypothetical protein